MGESGFQGREDFDDMIIEDGELERELSHEAREAKAIHTRCETTHQGRKKSPRVNSYAIPHMVRILCAW